MNIHPSEQHFWLTTHRNSAIAAIACALAAWSIVIIASFVRNPIARIGTLATGLTVCVAGNRTRRITRASHGILKDVEDISDQARQNRLYNAFRPTQPSLVTVTTLGGSYTPRCFDWQQFSSSPERFPHVMIEGSTGTGKTSLAEWLLSLLSGDRLVITPKRRVSQWRGMKVVGAPLDFRLIADTFEQLLDEMKSRYELMNIGQEDYPPLNFVVDEYPLIAANCDGISDTMLMLVRAAREAGMRLILIAQGSEGKALDIEGQTSVRECFTRVRLGKHAIEHARKLKAAELVEWLEQQDRPCMVDDEPALVPNLAGFRAIPLPGSSGFPVLQDAEKPAPPTPSTEDRIRALLAAGNDKAQVIWEIWQLKPSKSAAYANAKREVERVQRKLKEV